MLDLDEVKQLKKLKSKFRAGGQVALSKYEWKKYSQLRGKERAPQREVSRILRLDHESKRRSASKQKEEMIKGIFKIVFFFYWPVGW